MDAKFDASGQSVNWKEVVKSKSQGKQANQVLTTSSQKHLLNGLGDIRRRNLFIDCLVSTQLGKKHVVEYPAHKLLLAANSAVLSDMIVSMGENPSAANLKDGKLLINLEIDGVIMDALLDFLYTGDVILNDENVVEMFTSAQTLKIESLQQLCEEYISTHITKETALSLLVDSHLRGAQNLHDHCIRIIAESIDYYFNEYYARLLELPRQCLANILKSEFRMDEHKVFKLVKNWGEARLQEYKKQNPNEPAPHLKEVLGDLVLCVRYVSLKKKFLKSEVMPLEILADDMLMRILFVKAKDPAYLASQVNDENASNQGNSTILQRRSSDSGELAPIWLRLRGSSWKTMADFNNEDEYAAYMKEALKPGMLLRAVHTYENVNEGDIGEFCQWNTGFPPCQCRWKTYGNTYWLHWRDLAIHSE